MNGEWVSVFASGEKLLKGAAGTAGVVAAT